MRIEELEGQESLFARDSGSGKTSSGRSAAGEILQRVKNSLGQTFKKSSKRSSKLKNHTFMLLDLRQGAGNILGPCWEYDPVWLGSLGTLNTSECPKDVVESSLWQILLDTVPSRYWLSQKACRGMLRRADCRGKLLPELLEIALSMQGGLIPPGPIPDELKAYHFNQRNEGIDLGDVAGALLATQNLQMQTFVTTPRASPDGSEESVAFAVNQRDEVRDLHGVAGALQAQPMGSPARTQRSGSRGERSRGKVRELLPTGGSEGYTARGDAVPPRAPKRKTGFCLSFFLARGGVKKPPFSGAPARTQRSGSRGERSRSGVRELLPTGRSEGYAACGDAVPPRAPKPRACRI